MSCIVMSCTLADRAQVVGRHCAGDGCDNISVAGRAETTAEASARRVRFINQESAQENVWRRYWRWFVGDFHRERS